MGVLRKRNILVPMRKRWAEIPVFVTVVAHAQANAQWMFNMVSFLSRKEIESAVGAENARDLIIGGKVNYRNGTLMVVFGDFRVVTVPLDKFRPNALRAPNFRDFEITDCGLSLRFGSYEVSSDSI